MDAPSLPSLAPALQSIVLSYPASTPPPGVTQNLENPAHVLTGVIIATNVLALFFVTILTFARVYTRAFAIRRVGWDDGLCVLAYAAFLAFLFLCWHAGAKTGVHVWDSRVSDIFFILQWTYYIGITYAIVMVLIKLSILLQYKRVFVPTRQTAPFLFYGIWFLFFVTLLFYVVSTLVAIFQCHPREAYWNKLIGGVCMDGHALLFLTPSFNLASDVLIFLLPLPTIWKLQMSAKRKLGLSFIFGLGGLVCVVSALRVQSSVDVANTLDIPWYSGPLGLWGVCEVSLALIACSLPTMPKFFQVCSKGVSKLSYLSSRTPRTSRKNSDPTSSLEAGSARFVYDGTSKAFYNAKVETTVTTYPVPEPSEKPSLFSRTWYRDQPPSKAEESIPSTTDAPLCAPSHSVVPAAEVQRTVPLTNTVPTRKAVPQITPVDSAPSSGKPGETRPHISVRPVEADSTPKEVSRPKEARIPIRYQWRSRGYSEESQGGRWDDD